MNIEDDIIVGTINFDSILNEEWLYKNFDVKGRGSCNIVIHPKEGSSIPHFHIVSDDSRFNCCIRIYENRYFSHGKNTGRLNSKECKTLNAWLKKPHSSSKYGILTNWYYIENLWREGHNIPNPPANLNQPDYTKILEG